MQTQCPFNSKYFRVYILKTVKFRKLSLIQSDLQSLFRSCQLSQNVRKGIFELNYIQVTLQQYDKVRFLSFAPSPISHAILNKHAQSTELKNLIKSFHLLSINLPDPYIPILPIHLKSTKKAGKKGD